MKNFRKSFLWGGFWGMIAWQAYGVLEYAAVTVAPLVKYPNMTLTVWHWKLSLMLLAFYSLAGFLSGAVGGVLAGLLIPWGASEQVQLRSVGTITLLLAFLANLFVLPEWSILIVTLIVAGILLGCLLSQRWTDRLALILNPWGASALLLLAGWVTNEKLGGRSISVRLIAGLMVVAVVIAGSWLAGRVLGMRRSRPTALGQAAMVVAGLAVVFGCGFALSPSMQLGVKIPDAPADRSKPNIILLTMDTVRADHLSLYGYPRNTTPNLVQLAESATVYAHPAAAGNMTLTSHASIFTGAYPSWTGVRPHLENSNVHGVGVPISTNYLTLAETLSRHGYVTAAVVANTGYLIPSFGIARGFQSFYYPAAIRMLPSGKAYCLRTGMWKAISLFQDTDEFGAMFLRAEEINRQAFRFLDDAKISSRPFLLFLNYMDAHDPYVPPAPYDTMFPGRDRKVNLQKYYDAATALAAGNGLLPELERDHFISQYDGGIAYMDSELGKLTLRLRQLGLFDNTLFIVTSDHGEALGDRNLIGHGISVYEDQVYVPLLIKYPGNSQKRFVNAPAGHTDLLPTIMDIVGIERPRIIQGRSLAGNGAETSRLLMSESLPDFSMLRGHSHDYIERALYSGKLKYIGSTQGKHELYDLSNDPREEHDLCSSEAAQCAAMQRDLETWTSTIPKSAGAPARLDPQTLERLKSLGYLGR